MDRRDAIKSIMAMLGASLSPSLVQALSITEKPLSKGRFSSEQLALVAAMSERIIPTTDTPGAIAAGVPAFMEEIVFSWYTEMERNIFLHGLQQVEMFSRQQMGSAFIKLPVELQDVVLQQMEIQGGGSALFGAIELMPSLKEDKKAFFPKLKELVVVGYYTSEIGATEELRYAAMPMSYQGDIPLQEGDRNWATSGFVD